MGRFPRLDLRPFFLFFFFIGMATHGRTRQSGKCRCVSQAAAASSAYGRKERGETGRADKGMGYGNQEYGSDQGKGGAPNMYTFYHTSSLTWEPTHTTTTHTHQQKKIESIVSFYPMFCFFPSLFLLLFLSSLFFSFSGAFSRDFAIFEVEEDLFFFYVSHR